ncbi:VanR-ABDEGLN family response regulator transcription factor [Ruminococcaceae bacterium OttesenSCG-928-D13]|nr:VanR-ABDEGLN family response regulator transcription factor [Ruminococcaceae bacterium OttesenSCG-928-D13]
MREKILIVDDEREIADLVALYLSNEGYELHTTYTAADALERVASMDLDLAILDVMLPDMDGFAICQKIRERHTYPIIMLTAKEDEIDKITGLTLGADDYVTKPFRPLEMVARVKAQMRRYKRYGGQGEGRDDGLITLGGLVINEGTHECTLDEKPLPLTPTEFTILLTLCQRRGQVVSAEELFHAVWGDEYYTKNNNTITVHIRHLREKMGETVENPRYIKTVWGVGYKIEQE